MAPRADSPRPDSGDRREAWPADQAPALQLEPLLANLPGMAYRCRNEPGWPMEFVSEGCSLITGHQPQDLLARGTVRFGDLIHPLDVARVWETIQTAVRSEAPYVMEYRLRTKAGEERWVWERGQAVGRDANGVRILEGFISDISERKGTEEELRKSASHLRALIETIPDLVWLKDPDGVYLACNRRFEALFGAPEAEILGKTDYDFVEPELASFFRSKDLEAIDARRSCVNEERVTFAADGHEEVLETIKTPMVDADGILVGVLGIGRDITERMHAGAERSRLVQALESAAETVVMTDLDGTIEYVNPAFERVTGYRREEALGLNPRILKSGKHPPAFYEGMWARLREPAVWSGRVVNRKKDGTLYTEEATISPVMDDTADEVVGYIAVKRDITHELELEAQLRQAQKLEALGTLAGGIAHDFNNILSPVQGYVDMTLEQLDPESPLHRYQLRVAKAARRASDLVQQILTFSRQTEQERRPVDLALLTRELLKFVRSTLPTTIEIRVHVDRAAGLVLADPTQIYQVLLNLCTNASQAMATDGGMLSVHVERCHLGPSDVREIPGLQPGAHVRVRMTDQGPGMEDAVRRRVFEPFFTTKPKGEGTGLGLAVVHGIVTAHDGAITVESRPGAGATFTVYLPAHESGCLGEDGANEGPPPGGTERILLLDDDAEVAECVRATLASLGYRVRVFASPEALLDAVRRLPHAYDLVLTDQVMRGMTGDELACKLRLLSADLPILIMSGSDAALERADAACCVTAVVAKPIGLRALAGSVRTALDGQRAHTGGCTGRRA